MLTSESPSHLKAPSLLKLGACFMYEALVLLAIAMLATFVFIVVAGEAQTGLKRNLLGLYLWGVIGVYLTRCWHSQGQTLAMQTWRMKLVDVQKGHLSGRKLALRYLLATLGLLAFGLGFLWAAFNKQHLFLHDQLCGLRIIDVPPAPTSTAPPAKTTP